MDKKLIIELSGETAKGVEVACEEFGLLPGDFIGSCIQYMLTGFLSRHPVYPVAFDTIVELPEKTADQIAFVCKFFGDWSKAMRREPGYFFRAMQNGVQKTISDAERDEHVKMGVEDIQKLNYRVYDVLTPDKPGFVSDVDPDFDPDGQK